MKVKKSIDLGDSGINIKDSFSRAITAQINMSNSIAYKNKTDSFNEMLQEIVDEAFQLGLGSKD